MFETPSGATPLEDEDIAGLIPTYLSTRSDLNLVEAENIAKARLKFLERASRYRNPDFLLTEKAICEIHKDMFDDVWKWAGMFRVRETNIGVAPAQIREGLHNLLLNTKERLTHCDLGNKTECEELALRFHWELVSIHPFPNGNGRHARLMADLLMQALGYPPFSWGSQELINEDVGRSTYLAALRKADSTLGDVKDLHVFAQAEQGEHHGSL